MRSSPLSRGLLIAIDRVAPSYQVLDFSLPVRPPVRFLLVDAGFRFDADVLVVIVFGMLTPD
jgi:hypothetical protein